VVLEAFFYEGIFGCPIKNALIMPIPVVPLSDAEVRKAKPREWTYKLFDGGGFYFEVVPSGSKL
jgi:hypothetical protein